MLTGKQVRVRPVKNRLVPGYLNAASDDWLDAAEQLLLVFRESAGRTRGEIEADLADLLADGPTQLIHQGLAKLLDDRCEYEVATDLTPDRVREAVFRLSAEQHATAAAADRPFDRAAVLAAAGAELGHPAEAVDLALFADLKDEQRVLTFDDCTPSQLLHRYNVALAQAVLLRAISVEIRVWGESAARFRQLFRQVKFRQLICAIRPTDNGYKLTLDGPLSLFSATQKYGLQLALFLPSLLHCKAFDLRADVRWGSDRKERTFTLAGTDGLQSHLPDFGMFTPPLLATFAANFRANVKGWALDDEPHPVQTDGVTWVPDFTLTHTASGKEVFIEITGYWRKVNLEDHYRRLKKAMAGRFVLVVSDQTRADEASDVTLGDGVYRYKRTPIAAEVAKVAARVAGI